ncbi:MAG: type 2 isopentenyl-diphosphate Delta-isomerase [Firmicutes bacterium]|jgi:isopentenyl-diphosphate delta-isomerase|nr:type 2 isopentenyl-diphosphate Delta-isomerase [Bacillota bacterium]
MPVKSRNSIYRPNRKDEHILLALRQKPGLADFSDIHLINNCLPERDLNEVTLETTLMGTPLRSPLFINAVTGGTPLAMRVNQALAAVAARCDLPMALGSQMAALENPALEATYRVVRRTNPRGVIWANLGSYASPEMVRRAVEMVGASAVQIHLNVPQELAMREGDCRFRGILSRIKEICQASPVPVIVKEVGFGIAREQALQLMEAGVAAIDVGGKGGTNFLAIENRRSGNRISRELLEWGLPTAITLLEVLSAVKGKVDVIAAGGVTSSLNIAKSLALGAKAVGLAGLPVYLLMKYGRERLVREIKKIEKELRLIMLMSGAANLAELRQVPLVITGATAEWLRQRNIPFRP